jgi:hypothetical protein
MQELQEQIPAILQRIFNSSFYSSSQMFQHYKPTRQKYEGSKHFR